MGVAPPAAAKKLYRVSVEARALFAGPSALCAKENGGTTFAWAGKPVIELPGETPTSPFTKLPVPFAFTADPPKIAKLCAAPSD
jgi:hypothetical protein